MIWLTLFLWSKIRTATKTENIGVFLMLLLFYAIMSRHIKGSNEYL